jgi:hypothetical protein
MAEYHLVQRLSKYFRELQERIRYNIGIGIGIGGYATPSQLQRDSGYPVRLGRNRLPFTHTGAGSPPAPVDASDDTDGERAQVSAMQRHL